MYCIPYGFYSGGSGGYCIKNKVEKDAPQIIPVERNDESVNRPSNARYVRVSCRVLTVGAGLGSLLGTVELKLSNSVAFPSMGPRSSASAAIFVAFPKGPPSPNYSFSHFVTSPPCLRLFHFAATLRDPPTEEIWANTRRRREKVNAPRVRGSTPTAARLRSSCMW